MKSRLATYMNLGARILASSLLAVIVTAAAGAQSAPAVSPAEARKAIQIGYAEWAKARLAMDKNTIERMLAPDLYVQTPDRKLTRQEFIDAIFSRPYTLTRFDATVLTVEPRGNDWAALVLEKLEGEIKDNSGKTSKIYVMGVARDGWRKLNDNQWTLLSSEQLGQQRWQDEIPPIANW
jgi:ketosteroid isomerase-like protein